MTPTLLVADASAAIRRAIESAFADQAMHVVGVADGREAIARIGAQPPPDIVLVDSGIPERNGYDVAAFVKSSPTLAHIPVLLMVGSDATADQARAREAGVDGVLLKPFEPPVVIAKVRELLARRGTTGRSAAATPDYLDRLDAAFAAMTTSPRPIGSVAAAQPDADDPGVARQVTDRSLTTVAAPRPEPSAPFVATMALSDATIDEIVRRVIARLGDESMRQAVLDVAERLVQQEIDRIKRTQRERQ